MHQGSHEFPFRRESQLVDNRSFLTQRQIVASLAVQPKQQCHLRGVTHPFRLLASHLFFQKSSGVSTDTFHYQLAEVIIPQLPVILQTIEIGFMHLHQILGQCTGLVGTNHCNGSHRLACMHLAHQVVGGEHAAHIQRQTECHAHRQAFGHSHHNQGNRHHKVLQSSLQGRQPITEGMK